MLIDSSLFSSLPYSLPNSSDIAPAKFVSSEHHGAITWAKMDFSTSSATDQSLQPNEPLRGWLVLWWVIPLMVGPLVATINNVPCRHLKHQGRRLSWKIRTEEECWENTLPLLLKEDRVNFHSNPIKRINTIIILSTKGEFDSTGWTTGSFISAKG